MPLIRKSKSLNALVFALVLLAGVLLVSQWDVAETEAQNGGFDNNCFGSTCTQGTQSPQFNFDSNSNLPNNFEIEPTSLEEFRAHYQWPEDPSTAGEGIDFDTSVPSPEKVQNLSNPDLERDLAVAEREYGMAPTPKNEWQRDILRKERYIRLQHQQMISGRNVTTLNPTMDSFGVNDDDTAGGIYFEKSGFESDGIQNNFLSDSAAFGMCQEGVEDYCNYQVQKDFTIGGGSELDIVKNEASGQFQEELQERKILWDCSDGSDNCLDNADENGGSGGSSTPSTVNVNGGVNCFGSGGTGTVFVNSNNVCSDTGGLPLTTGTFNFNLASGAVFGILLNCTGGTCQMDLTSITGATCGITPPTGSLSVFGAGSSTTTCTVN